jgi:SAM-dependent methyltransferase
MNPITNLQNFLDRYLAEKSQPRILEAGCGSASHLCFKENCCLTGIDISEKQLQRNAQLHEKILGDVQYYRFQPETFDIIICWDVLEHLVKPELALDLFARAVKPEGIIILASPNPESFKGLLTRYSPHWFHVLFYRVAYHRAEAGQDDSAPFKAYLQTPMAPRSLRKFAHHKKLKIVYFHAYNLDLMERNPAVHFVYQTVNNLARLLSLGKLQESEYIMVLQK